MCAAPCSAFPIRWQSSCLLRCSIKPSFYVLLKWNLQRLSGLEGAAWELQRTSIADLDGKYRPHLLPLHSTLPRVFYCSPDFEGPQMLADWHVLPLYSCHFAASRTECLEDDTCWAPAASACGVCLEWIVAPFEGSGRVFVPVLYFVGWEESHTARSDGVYHWQAEWWLLNRLRNMTDLQRQRRSSCQFSHIHEPISVGRVPQPALSM